MTPSPTKNLSHVLCGFSAFAILVILPALSNKAHAQNGVTPWPSQNLTGTRNSNYPPYAPLPSSGRQPQRTTNWGQTNRQQTNNYPVSGYTGLPYPGLPASSLTYVQPDGNGGYVIGSYGSPVCGANPDPSTYSLYNGMPGYVVVDEGAVQDILPVNPTISYNTGYPDSTAPPYQNNEYNYTVNNYYSTPDAPETSPPPASQVAPAVPQDIQPLSASPTKQSDQSSAVQGYDLALGDIQQAWSISDFSLIKKYLPAETDTIKLTVAGQGPFAVSPSQFAKVTQDAFVRLTTYSIVITEVHKQADGSVTGYMTHTYAPVGQTDGKRNTIYLAYTLTDATGSWLISRIESSTSPIAQASAGASSSKSPGVTPASSQITAT